MAPTIRMFAFTAAALLAARAPAHPRLLQASPAAGATVAPPKTIALHFSEGLIANLTGGQLSRTDPPRGNGKAPPAIATAVRVDEAAKTLLVQPARPLAPGSYRLDYHVVSVDTHRVTGSLAFRVR